VRIVKGLWAGGPFAFEGKHYSIDAPEGVARPLQRPHSPLFIGGGGRRVLALAAREADIVGLIAQAERGGGLALAGDSEAVLGQKADWVRGVAGERFAKIELAMLMWGVAVTNRPREAAESLGRPRGLSAEQVLASPYFLIGSSEAIAERLRGLRERYGVSHISVMPPDVDVFAPVVARPAGQ
jgi:alkanesulfonate monooxygenase SsuD/methylene tetrahydromethanopterin reductase-like flavin-dependent oxidoreductase (luciferase family)